MKPEEVSSWCTFTEARHPRGSRAAALPFEKRILNHWEQLYLKVEWVLKLSIANLKRRYLAGFEYP